MVIDNKNAKLLCQYTHLNSILEQDYTTVADAKVYKFLEDKYSNFKDMDEIEKYFVSCVHGAFSRSIGKTDISFKNIYGFSNLTYLKKEDVFLRTTNFVVYTEDDVEDYAVVNRDVKIKANGFVIKLLRACDFVYFLQSQPVFVNNIKSVVSALATTLTEITGGILWDLCLAFDELKLNDESEAKVYEAHDQTLVMCETFNFAKAKHLKAKRESKQLTAGGRNVFLYYNEK